VNIFQQLFRMAESCVADRFTQFWVIAIFSTIISQGSVLTRLRYGRIFNYYFVRNLLLSLPVKEVWKIRWHLES